nr:MAG TPA: hypothetical protein [Caudoviricetes sp.]
MKSGFSRYDSNSNCYATFSFCQSCCSICKWLFLNK